MCVAILHPEGIGFERVLKPFISTFIDMSLFSMQVYIHKQGTVLLSVAINGSLSCDKNKQYEKYILHSDFPIIYI